ncbi:hypothetical protein CMI37_06860, partial [Candidatus Pacearchaeota archaeon]|nr:hypothetical protein [Candidatus Pacearchaeota archaeon]
ASSIPVEARETRRTLQLPAGDAPAAAADTPGAAAATAPGSPERARARAIELGHRTPEETNEALIDQLGLAPDYEGQKPYPQADDGLPPTAYLYTSGSTEITQARRWAKGKKTGPKYAAARKTVAMALEASGASTQPYQMAHFIHRLYLGELSEYPHFVTEWLGTHGAPPTAYLPTVREVEELFDILHRRPTNYPGDWVAGSVDGWPALDVEMAFDDRVKIARRASEIEQVAPPAAAAPEGATARVPREEAMRQSAEDVATEFFEDNIRDQFRHYEPGVQGAINDLAEGLRKGYGPDEISDLSGGQLLDPDGGHASAQALIDDYQGRVARLRSGVPLDEELKPGYMWRSDLEDELGRPIGAAPEQAAAPPPKPDPDLELRAASPEVQRYVARAEAAGRLTPPSTPEEIIDELMLMQGSEKAGRDVLGTAIERRHPQMLEDWLVNTGSVTEADAPGLSQSLLRRVERDVIPEGQTGLLDAPPRTPEDESERLIAEAEMTGGFAEGPDDFAPAPGSISAEVGPMIDRTPTAAAAAPPGGGAPPPRQPPPAPPGGPPAGAAPEPDNLGFERPLTSTPADEVQPPLPAAVEGAPSGLHRTGQPTLGYVTPPQEGIPFAAGSAEEAGDAMNRVRATRSAGGSLTDDIDPAFLQGTAFPPTAPPPGYVAMPIAGSGGKKEVFFLPREIRDAITQRLDPARQVAFVRGFDSLNSIYRVSVTQFFTDYHMRNMWSNYWRMMLDGVWNPIYGVKAAQVMRAARSGDASKRININGVIKDGAHKGLGGTDGKVTAAELFEVAENYGAFASLESRTGELAEIAGGALSGATMDIRAAGLTSKAGIVSRFVSWVSGPGQYAETFMRLMHLLGRLDKGDDLLEAIAHVRKFQVDYTDLTQVERMMGRRVSFFYTYMRKSMALEVEQMIKGRRIGPLPIGPPIRNVQRARDWLQQELDPEGEELKEEVALWRRWVWDRLNIGVGRDDKGNPMILYATGLPIEFFNQWWAGTAKRTMQNTLNQWNPLVKMWIEMATNKSFFTKGDIDNPSHQNFLGHVDEITAGFPGLSQWLEVEKETIIDSETGEERTFYHANPSRVHVWMSLMPGMARMLRTADDVVNSDMGVGARLLNLFTGAKITSFDITSQVSQGYSSDHGAAFDTYNEDYEDLAERFLRNELTGMEFTKSRRELRDNLGEALSNADTRLREKQEDPYVDPEDVRRQAQLGALGAEAAELQRIENLDPASFMLDGLINWDAYWRTRDAMVEGLSPAQRTRWWKQEREYLDRLGPAAREVEEMYLDALEVTQAIAELPRYKLPDGRWLSDEIAARIDDANKEISTWARGRGPGSWNMSAIEYIRQGGPPGSSDSREFRQETVSLIRRSRYWYNPEITAIRQQNQVVLARVFGDSALGPLNTANEQLAPVGARDTFVGAGVSQ